MSWPLPLLQPHCKLFLSCTRFLFLTHSISNKLGYVLIKNNSKISTDVYFSLMLHFLWVWATLSWPALLLTMAKWYISVLRHACTQCPGPGKSALETPCPQVNAPYLERILVPSTHFPLDKAYYIALTNHCRTEKSIHHKSRRRTSGHTGEQHKYLLRIPHYLSPPCFSPLK